MFALGLGHARAIVFNFEQQLVALPMHAHGYGRAPSCIADRVVDQVDQHLAQQQADATDFGRGRRGPVLLIAIGFVKAQIDAGQQSARHHLGGDITGQLSQIDRQAALQAG